MASVIDVSTLESVLLDVSIVEKQMPLNLWKKINNVTND